MANPGTLGTFDLNVGIKLDVEDVIWLISPYDVPFQGMYGADNLSALSADFATEVKVEWLDEQLLLPKSQLSAAIVTADTALPVQAGAGVNFQTGDEIVINSEHMRVTGYGSTADWLTVSRHFNGTSAASAASGDQVLCVGSVLVEGSDPNSARAADRVDRVNYTQVFGPTAVTISGTEQVVRKYGLVGTEFDHQAANRVKEEAIKFEQAIVYGIPQAGSAGSYNRSMGGIDNYITTNVDSGTTSITESALLTEVQACFDAGGSPNRIAVGSQQKRNISAIANTEIRYAQETNTRSQVVDYIETDFGLLTVVLNRWIKKPNLYIFAREQATLMTLRPFAFEMLAKTGDSVKGQVVGEKSMRFRRQSWAAKFTALT